MFQDPTGRRRRTVRLIAFSLIAVVAGLYAVLLGGFLHDQRVPPIEPSRLMTVEHLSADEPVSLPAADTHRSRLIAFLVSWDPNSFASLKRNLSQIDLVIPEWYWLADAAGGIKPIDSGFQERVAQYLRERHSDLPVVPLVTNFDPESQQWQAETLVRMLADPRSRTAAIERLFDEVRRNGYAGVHVDFEAFPESSGPALVLFMRELWERFHTAGLEVSQSVPVARPGVDLNALASFVDFLVLMAYDEHTLADDLPGPLASQPWYEENIALRLAEIPREKTVVSLGSYAYDWGADGSFGASRSFTESLKLAEMAGAQIVFDRPSANPVLRYRDTTDRERSIWLLDAVTAFNQIRYAELYEPMGYALWRLGSEDPSIWRVLERRDRLDGEAAQTLRAISSDPGVTYVGEGEVLRVTATPRDGLREILYDDETAYIVAQSIGVFPRALEISRFGATALKQLVLTFDDGPDPRFTPQILDILREHHVKATFFVTGLNAIRYPDIVKRIVVEGHEIGHHTLTHPDISRIADWRMKAELNSLQRFFQGTLGTNVALFRPPYGEDAEPRTLEEARALATVSRLGYLTVAAYVDPRDWEVVSETAIVQQTVRQAQTRRGQIILLHDGGGNRSATVAALAPILENLKREGFRFASLATLLDQPAGRIMPKISAGQAVFARINHLAYGLAGKLMAVVAALFGVCITIGIIRSILTLALAIARRIRLREWRQAGRARVGVSADVIVPAFNEEKVICKTIDSLLQSENTAFGIIVVDDGSTDATFQVVQAAYKGHPRVQMFKIPNGGKCAALNFGIERSRAEVVVTLDADTIFSSDTVDNLLRPFRDAKIGAVAGNAKVGNRQNALTRCQALEYVTGQNLERRSYDLLNCISVVPGAVSAWRRDLVLAAGGFSAETLAEDADLTFHVHRLGYKVVYSADAVGYTEAPETVRGFINQRVRWMYGTLQTVWKHRGITFRPRYGALGLYTIPSIYIFQMFFPLFSVVVELLMLSTVGWHLWQLGHHPTGEVAAVHSLAALGIFYLLFLSIELAMSLVAFLLEPYEDKRLLVWVLVQRFFYRPLLSLVAIRTASLIVTGRPTGWNKVERTATVQLPRSVRIAAGA